MQEPEIDLRSTNWQQGMLLGPAHFRQQERYFESLFRWLARYCMQGAGLLGDGVRAATAQNVAAYDPIINTAQNSQQLSIEVSQVRAISDHGWFFEIAGGAAVKATFPLEQFAGINAIDVYVIPGQKQESSATRDEFNPTMNPHLVPGYEIALNLDEGSLMDRILVGRLVRLERGQRFEVDGGFIPPCVTVSAHSQMRMAWSGCLRMLRTLAESLIELHKSMLDYLDLLKGKGLNLNEDQATLEFVGRLVVAIEHCIHETMDPSISPERFLRELFRLIRTSAVFLKVSPPTQAYFNMLAEAGLESFLPIIESQLDILQSDRAQGFDAEIADEMQRAMESIGRLEKLVEGIGAKYLDYRMSRTLDKLQFVILRETNQLLEISGKATHSQASQSPRDGRRERTIIFGRIGLEDNRRTYSIILLGDDRASFHVGEKIHVKIYVNASSGYEVNPIQTEVVCQIAGQKNFHVSFKAEMVGTVSDVRISLLEDLPIQTALLYVPKQLLAVSRQAPPLTPPPEPIRKPPEIKEPASPPGKDGRSPSSGTGTVKLPRGSRLGEIKKSR